MYSNSLCFSPINLSFMTYRISTKSLEGERESCFSCHARAMEHDSAIEGNEPSTHGKTQVSLMCILLSERIQSEGATWSMTPLMTSRKDKATQMLANQGVGV